MSDETLSNKELASVAELCQTTLPIERKTFSYQLIPHNAALADYRAKHHKSNLGVAGVSAVYNSPDDTIFIYVPLNADITSDLRHEWAHAFSGQGMYTNWTQRNLPEEGVFLAEAFAEYYSINTGEPVEHAGSLVQIGELTIPENFIKYKQDGTIFYSGLAAYALSILINQTELDFDLMKRIASGDKSGLELFRAELDKHDSGLLNRIYQLMQDVGYNEKLYINGCKYVVDAFKTAD